MSGEGEAGAAPGQDRARSPRRSGSPPPRGPPQRFSDDEREQDSYSDDAAGKPRRSLPLGRSPPPGSDPWTPRSRSGSPRRSASYSQGQSPARARGRPSPAEHHRGRRSPPPGRGGGGGGGGGQQSDLRTIYVGGLASDTKDTDVADFFTRYGNVTNVKLIYHHDTQEFRGFGFVTFDSQRCAEEAADIGNGHEILGSRIRVNLAKYNKPPGRQQYPPHHQPRDFRRGPPDGPDGGGPPWMMRGNNMGGPPGMYPPHGRAPPPYMYPPRGPPPRSPPPRSPTPPRYPPPRHRPGEGPDADLPAPKRRRRSPSPPPRSAEVAPPPADRKPSDEVEKIRGDLLRVRSERSQAQAESAQLQLQLQELADKANNKLYDYRLKLKGAKKRSQLRGQHMMSLVEAARNVQSCHEQVKDAEKALEVAKAQLFTCISESDDYIGLERAEDEASNLDRDKQGRAAADDVPQDTAPAGPDGSLRGNTSLSGGERENQNGNAGRLGTTNESGLALKPFKISLEQ